MTDERYLRLREFLDRFPLGFPRTGSGVEIKILKRLFTPDEAELAAKLSPLPEDTASIARRTGIDRGHLDKKLDSMSRRGLVFRVKRGENTLFRAVPFMIGLYEYSVKAMDRELAALYREYYDSAYRDEMGASGVPGFKVIPVAGAISAATALFPSASLRGQIMAARKISVADCICRKEARLTGAGCDHPMETCLSFGAAAEYYIENGTGREIGADEALTIIEESDRAGLVHAGVNTRHLSNICNCCPCCCASMRGITEKGMPRKKFFNALFEAVIDLEKCGGCGYCLDRCPVGAISADGAARVDRTRCLGCGLCAGACPSGAVSIQARADREEPFGSVVDLGMAIIQAKGGCS